MAENGKKTGLVGILAGLLAGLSIYIKKVTPPPPPTGKKIELSEVKIE
jgi:hypothetical protein